MKATPIVGVHSFSSVGVARYCRSLASELVASGVDYRLSRIAARYSHLHFANSCRLEMAPFIVWPQPFLVTVHDARPRDGRLMPAYHRLIYPRILRRAARVIAHSQFTADMIEELCGVESLVIPHPVLVSGDTDRLRARTALRWPRQGRIAVLPGVVKPAKMVEEALTACSRTGWQLVLAGAVTTECATSAQSRGVIVLDRPSDSDYLLALAAADLVLVLRADSVGETNGPLLDAIGAGRALLATTVGSAPELAQGAGLFVEPTEEAIAIALCAMTQREQEKLEAGARQLALRYLKADWARAHARLFTEVWGQ